MKRDVVLSIQGRQRYGEQEPETIELVTGGTMEFRDGGWDITYEESELTGLAGVVYRGRSRNPSRSSSSCLAPLPTGILS